MRERAALLAEYIPVSAGPSTIDTSQPSRSAGFWLTPNPSTAILCAVHGFRLIFSSVAVLAALGAWPAERLGAQAPTPPVDAAFQKFWEATTPADAAALVAPIIQTGVGFDDALRRLKQGRTYAKAVPTGIVRKSLKIRGLEAFHVLNVPDGYDPAKKYAVRFQLHGGVTARTDNQPLGPDTIGMLAGPEQIYVIPYSWRDAPWWGRTQLENLRTIVDSLKRTYNVDENRVVISGVSDGGTGAFYISMRDTTPYASFLPLNGFIMVLANGELGVEGDLSPNNLKNKPLFIVNGAQDPLYPTSVVDPFVAHMKKGGVEVDYQPQANGGHDLRWWPKVRDTFETFVESHPRTPLPDRLTFETAQDDLPERRAHWLIIDKLGPQPDDAKAMADLNDYSPGPTKDFGLRTIGSRVIRVVPETNAAAIGFVSTDYIVRVNDETVRMGTEITDVLGTIKPGSPITFLVSRRNQPVELKGTFAPTDVDVPAEPVFPHRAPAGRVDLVRTGNTVEATTRGVAAFTLLLSPDQFDFSQPVKVVANGRTVFEGAVQKDLATLLKWAAQDNDRTMLFGTELHISLAR
jgi:hypothetical protein